jgi:hypothetical protein
MNIETAQIANEFVDALTDFFLKSKRGSPSLSLRSRLAKARAEAQRRLTAEQYRSAVFMAHRAAG